MLTRFRVVTVLLAALLGCGLARACDDHSENLCSSGKKTCQIETSPWTFDDGTEIGLRSATLTHADMVQGCYCQYAQMDVILSPTKDEYPTAYSNNTLVTTCSSDFNAYWNGEHVMSTTGGTLGDDYDVDSGYSYKYDKMLCKQTAYDSTAAALVPNSGGLLHLINWTTSPALQLEVTLPSNVAFYNTSNDECPGIDVQEGFHPNTIVATELTAAQVQNCSCTYSAAAAIGDSGTAESNDGNSFWTVCDASMSVYFNGKGFRTARNGASDGNDLVSDFCHATMSSTAASHVAYVKPVGSGSDGGGGGGSGSGGGGSGGSSGGDNAAGRTGPLAYGSFITLFAVALLTLQ